jgi:rod shape-determining protein MreC
MLAIHRRTLYLLLAVSVGHVLLISVQVQSKSGLPVLEAAAFGTFARIQQGVTATGDGVRGLWHHYVALVGVARDNDALRRQIVELQGSLEAEQAISSRTRSLEDALRLQPTVPARTLAARIIAGSPAPDSRTVTIDRGAADGIRPDMAVLAVNGVVGRIVNRPSQTAAEVQLLTSRTAAAGAYLERTGAGGVIQGGMANPPLEMVYVKDLADVRAGDRVLTSGEDGIYPRGFLIGTVERAVRGAGQYQTAAVRPVVDFSHLDVVLVVLDRPPGPGGTGAKPPAPAARGGS